MLSLRSYYVHLTYPLCDLLPSNKVRQTINVDVVRVVLFAFKLWIKRCFLYDNINITKLVTQDP